MNTANFARGDWIIGGVALLLVIDLLPWFDLSAGPFSISLTATDAPSGWAGILAVLADFSDFGFGFWLGVILAAGLVYVSLPAQRSPVGVASA